MKKGGVLIVVTLILLSIQSVYSQNRYWIATISGNWNNTANWSTTTGGAGGASVPTTTNVAIFNGLGGRNGNCILDIAPTVGGITSNGYSGTIDLQGFTLTTTGTNTFTTGIISNSGAAASLALNSAGTTTFNGTTFNADISGSSGRIFFSGSVFNGIVNVTKSGTASDNGTGGNTFNNTVTLTDANTSDLQFAGTNPDIFQGTLTLNINSTGDIALARVATGNQFNGDIIINYNATGGVSFGVGNGTSTLATGKRISVAGYGVSGCGNLLLEGFIQIGTTAQTLTLAGNNNALLNIGPNSTFNGQLTASSPNINLETATFNGITQITKTGTTTSNLRGGNIFTNTTTIINQGGDLVFGHISTDAGDTFNGTTTFNNLGGYRIRVSEQSAGTVFNGTTTFNCQGVTDVQNRIQVSRLAGGQTTFNGAVYFVSNGYQSDIQISYDAGTSTTFNGPVSFTSSASNGGDFYVGNDGDVIFNNNMEFNSTCTDVIYVSQGSGTVTFGNGIMSIGSGGFAQGQIRLRNFTQSGSASQSLTLTGTSSLYLGPSSLFNGVVNFVTPQIYLNGCTFNSTTYIEKTGAATNIGSGSNIFNGVTTLVNSGSGNFISGSTSVDNFNNDLTLTNTGSALISMADNSAGNVFAGNITVNSTSGGGIYFGNNAGASATLASGKTITVGSSGFSAGDLRLKRFTKLGSAALGITLSGTAILTLGPATQFGGNVSFITPQLYLNGVTFNGAAYLEKNGATDNVNAGGDVFNGATTIVNSGSGTLDLANTNPETFNSTLTVNNTGTYRIQIGVSSAGNIFNGNVTINHGGNNSSSTNTIIARNAGSTATFNGNLTLNCTNLGGAGTGIIIANDGAVTINGNVTVSTTNGRGVLFGLGAGTVTLANGYTISAGTFNTGTLTLKGFTQVGSSAQALTLTGTAILTIGPISTFNGAVNFLSPRVSLDGGTFNATTTIQKNGATNDDNTGGNIFNATTTLTSSGVNRWRLANTTADTYNADVTFVRSGAGAFDVAYAQTNNFGGNITLNSAAGVTFGGGGGTVQLNGSNAQTINKVSGSASPVFPRLVLAKTSNAVTLNTDASISTAATFTIGLLNTTSTNYLNFADNATVASANNASYVDGPVRKTGDDAFTFPVGNGGYYRPISISAPGNVAHHFTAQYFKAAQTYGGPSTWDPAFYSLSGCEYWILDRTSGTSNVSVTLSWNASACGGAPYSDLSALRVARFNTGTSRWVNEGNGSTTGNSSNGTITSSAAVTTFSPFTLASTNSLNPLPIELGNFWANDFNSTVQLNWITYSEENNDYFTIERSLTSFDFTSLGEMKGAGTSNEKLHYDFIDESPLDGLSYYRLKQTDFDGKHSYSKTIVVKRKGEGLVFMVYPNPASDELVKLNQKANITVTNNIGQVIATAHEIESFDASILIPGIYTIKNQKGEVVKFIKK